jgi:DNA topoisomerase-1
LNGLNKLQTLVIVESPHKAQLIQGFLGKDYVVLASVGHITELAKGGKFGLGVDVENNFKPRYVISADKIEVLNNLMNAAKQCDQILIASDPDYEGEAIAWHLKSRLEDIGKPIKRVVFHEIKKTAVLKAFKNPRDIDLNMFHAQEARRILDRLVGFMASPFLMNFFGPKLSAGRVQSVVTRLIVDREKEIEVFIPEEFWTIQVALSKDNKRGFITKYPGKLSDKKSAENIFNKLSDKKSEYIVSNVLAQEEIKSAPPPLITSTLQRIMSKQHNMSPDRTSAASQKLYESGYVSYIRTDSVRCNDETIEELRQWLIDNNYPIPNKVNVFKNKDAAQDAHECIHPTDITLSPHDNMAIIDPDEKLVYETIWTHFVASQMMPAVYNTLRVTAHVKGDTSSEVKCSGKALKTEGYLSIFGVSDTGQIDIPNLIKGDTLYLFGNKPVVCEKKLTQAPPRYSEDKLIHYLEMKSIGRPSTYGELLSKVTSRNYVEKNGNVFHSTELGEKITNELVKYFTFMDYSYTADLLKKIDLIAQSKQDYIELLHTFFNEFKKELGQAYLSNGGMLCTECGAPMNDRVSKQGDKFKGCSRFPMCKKIINV